MNALIEIAGLTKRFGPFTAVDGISFSVERGEVLGFLGPNGAGKSTTMKMVTGFLAPTSGSIRVAGHDVLQQPIQAQKRIGYLPEGAPLYPDMTPDGLLRFVAEIRGLFGAAGRNRIAEIVERVHVANVLHQPIETLSKGYKRRVGLAIAILHDPEVLVLDEPTDGLDPNQKAEVRTLIAEMSKSKAIVLSTHILEEVEAVCTRAVIIDRGRIVVDGTPAELESRSRFHNAVRITVPASSAAAVRRELEAIPGVASVEDRAAADGRAALLAVPRSGASLVSAVSECARRGGWRLDELSVERGRLDDVFRALTRSDLSSTDELRPAGRGGASSPREVAEEVTA